MSDTMPEAASPGAASPEVTSPRTPVTNYAALTALITGLVGIVLVVIFFATDAGPFVLWFGGVLGILGVIFGIVALRRRQMFAMALAGLIAGGFAVMGNLLTLLFVALFTAAFTASLG